MKNKYDMLSNGLVVNTMWASDKFVNDAYGDGNYALTEDVLASIQMAKIIALLEDAEGKEGSEWEAYRNALFDLPNDEDYPHNVTWPTKPT